jgi:hypothetical protein
MMFISFSTSSHAFRSFPLAVCACDCLPFTTFRKQNYIYDYDTLVADIHCILCHLWRMIYHFDLNFLCTDDFSTGKHLTVYLFPPLAVSVSTTHEQIRWGLIISSIYMYGSSWWVAIPKDAIVYFLVCTYHQFWTTLGMSSPSSSRTLKIFSLCSCRQLRCCRVPQTSWWCYWLLLLQP